MSWRNAYASRGDQDLLRSLLPKSRLLVYEQVGHALHWEQPLRFVNDLADFVATLGNGEHAKHRRITV